MGKTNTKTIFEHVRWRESAEAFADFGDDLVFVGKGAGLEFGVEEIAVRGQFETAAGRGFKLQGFDFLLVGREQFGRQTDGLGLVVSCRTVTQVDSHRSKLLEIFVCKES